MSYKYRINSGRIAPKKHSNESIQKSRERMLGELKKNVSKR